jgi:hypothetical protein
MRVDRPYIFGRDVVGLVVSTLQRLSSGPCHVEDAAVVTFMLNRKNRSHACGSVDLTHSRSRRRGGSGSRRPCRVPRGAKPQKQGALFLSVMLPRTNRKVARTGEISR